MIRLAGGGLVGFLLIALWLYCIFDVIATDEVLVRSLPKLVWLFIVVVLPTIGSIAWLALGRPVYAGWRPGDTGGRLSRRVVGPEDRPDFPSSPSSAEQARLRAWEDDLKRREQQLGKDKPEDPPPPTTW